MNSHTVQAELDLAKLMGWTELQVGGQERGFNLPTTWVIGLPPGSDLKDRELVPAWTREDGAAFRLAVQARIHFAIDEDGRGWAEHIDGGDYIEFETVDGDLSKLRLAIVKVATTRCRAAAQEAAEQKGGAAPLTRCAAGRDGECGHAQCPQVRDGEPARSRRHCPLDVRKDGE